jgi:hypothetical protein
MSRSQGNEYTAAKYTVDNGKISRWNFKGLYASDFYKNVPRKLQAINRPIHFSYSGWLTGTESRVIVSLREFLKNAKHVL